MSVLICFNTCPDRATAGRLAAILVSERLAACVNMLPGVRSTYVWEGTLQQDEEVLLVIKTTRERYPALQARLAAAHPYELPELVAVEAVDGLPSYLQWVAEGTRAVD